MYEERYLNTKKKLDLNKKKLERVSDKIAKLVLEEAILQKKIANQENHLRNIQAKVEEERMVAVELTENVLIQNLSEMSE